MKPRKKPSAIALGYGFRLDHSNNNQMKNNITNTTNDICKEIVITFTISDEQFDHRNMRRINSNISIKIEQISIDTWHFHIESTPLNIIFNLLYKKAKRNLGILASAVQG